MNARSLISIFILLFYTVNASSNPCPFQETANISSGYKDGNNFIYEGITLAENTFALYDYIIVNGTERVTVAAHYRGCICKYRTCIRLCCLGDAGVNDLCMKSNTLHVPINDTNEKIIDISSHEYGILLNRPCLEMFRLHPDDEDHWIFQQNGSIELNGDFVYNTSRYCLGHVENKSSGHINTDIMLCSDDENAGTDVRHSLYPIGMIISMPFLIITFLVYALIPELRNLHGKCLLCYIFSLMALYTSLTIVQLNETKNYAGTYECIFLGYSIYISVFLCFFWLNIMCIDIWSTFKGGMGRGRSDTKRFALYSLYAFGCPIILTIIVFCIDNFQPFKYQFLPRIGVESCYVNKDHTVQAIYIYIPITIIIIVNITLYSITACKIWREQKATSVIINANSQRHSKREADTDRFFLYLRLFIIMGVMWSMESISFVFNSNFHYVSDFLNCLQGLIIFLLFVWKPKVKQLIVKRYRAFRNIPSNTMQSTVTETTGISSSPVNRPVPSSPSTKPMLAE